jgi:hypothetical protein
MARRERRRRAPRGLRIRRTWPQDRAIPTSQGVREITIGDAATGAILDRYWKAIHLFSNTGDSSALLPFHGQHIIDAYGNRVPLLTDLDELERLGDLGALSYESIYARQG